MKSTFLHGYVIAIIAAGLLFTTLFAPNAGGYEIVGWGINDNGQATPPDGNDFTAIAAGSYHSLALKSDGSIVGWGYNSDGQATPPAGNDFAAVAAGFAHSIALKSDGSIVGWGWNNEGQATHPEGNDFIAVAAGGSHNIALKSDGSIVGWGYNSDGQATPPAGNDFTAIAANGWHSLAIKSDGSIVGWGYNSDGQATPPAGNDFTAIAAGYYHSLAIKSDGSIVGWGRNAFGESTPPAGNNFIAIDAGGAAVSGSHSLALKSNGSIVAQGINTYGQATPPEGRGFVAIAAGASHSLALRGEAGDDSNTSELTITKCTVTAGKTEGHGTIVVSGEMNATADDLSGADNIEVTVVSEDIASPYVQSFPRNSDTFKNDKYSYSGTEDGVTESFKYDVKTGKFSFTAKNVDLSGLGCPLTIEIEIGDYTGTAEVNETIVNGTKKPIPIKLMTGVKNVLRVDKCQVKQNNKKSDSDQLTASGGFAVENADANMADRVSEDLVVTLDTQLFTIPKSALKAGKGKFTCSKAEVTGGGVAAASFDFNKCSFTLTIKNANIPVISGTVDFGAAFADYNEVDLVTLP